MTIDQIKAMNKPIALIGMMGVGKTHVGKVLAKRLGYEFIDTDQTIEQDQGRFITQIFAQQGEAAFRQMELAAITKALQAPNTVIATGGGCIKTPAIRKAFAQSALTCWLQATPEQIFNRIKDDTTRPLLQTENPLQTLRPTVRAPTLLQRRTYPCHNRIKKCGYGRG